MSEAIKPKQETFLKANLFVPAELIESLTKEQASGIITHYRGVMNQCNDPMERHNAKTQISKMVSTKYAKRSCRYCGKDTDGAVTVDSCSC